ncbi:MAG: hypothetical protein WCK47_00810 [bacterium]
MKTGRTDCGTTFIKLITGLIIVVILGALSVYAYSRWSENDRGLQCQKNLALISAAIQKYAVDNNRTDGSAVSMNDLTTTVKAADIHGYLQSVPGCPSDGKYSLGPVGEAPKCSIGDKNKPFTPHILR